MLTSPLSRAAVVAALTCAIFPPSDSRADAFEPQFRPEVTVSRAPGPIRIDGDLDDPGWRTAARATGFAEISPGDQTEPAVHSEAWITYDDANLYVALIARDDPEEVRVSVCDRDQIFRDDYFGVMLDTYGDQSWGYELFVNPLGIQGDLRMHSDGSEDIAFDLVWDSRGRVTDEGYRVELAIPFASLRFPGAADQTWRINFWRDHQRDVRRRYAWAAIDRDDPCFMCQWGTLTGLEAIEPGRNLEIIASAVGTQAGALSDSDDPLSDFDNGNPDADAALNLRYALSSNASAELTLNPDFSQVESDAGVIDVNNTFAIDFPERRPFFQEGSDLYGTWIDAIYTRSINDPDVAAKLTGQFDETSLVYLFGKDNLSPLILPFEERSIDLLFDESVSNVARVRRTLREDSYVGALVTDRRLQGGGGGTVAGVDGRFRFLRNYRLEIQGTTSHTEEPNAPELTADEDIVDFDSGRHTVALDEEKYWGHALYASLERSARTYDADLDYWEYSPTFRTENGFTTRNDFREVNFWNGFHFRPNRSGLVEWEPSVSVGRIWSYDNRFKDEWIRPNLWFNLKGQTNLNLQYLASSERFGPETFDGIRIWSGSVDTRFSEILGGGFSVNFGRGIYRDFDDPELARQRRVSVYFRLKPSRRLELQTDWDYSRMDSRKTDEELFAGYILRNRLTLNFTRQWFLRLIVQHNDFRDRLDIEPLLTYRISPFTVFYVGSTSRYQRYAPEDHDVLQGDEWRQSSRQFFAKLQYLFRM